MASAIWNVDKGYANELIGAVLRNPNVVSVRNRRFQMDFAQQGKAKPGGGSLLIEPRDMVHNGARCRAAHAGADRGTYPQRAYQRFAQNGIGTGCAGGHIVLP